MSELRPVLAPSVFSKLDRPLKSSPMSYRCRSLILLTVLFWQSLTLFHPSNLEQRASELEHMVVHGLSESHHHNADEALHMDDDDGLVQHLHADSGGSPAGILTSLQSALVGVRSMSPPEMNHSIWISPTLEGPLRPPMQHA